MNKQTHQRIFSGIQPTGHIHLGNYLGAIKNWVQLQDNFQCVYCIVDMHAITVQQDPVELYESILELTATLLACGIDNEKNILFQQSANSDHATLAWIFNCVSRMGWLNRMTQFKEKAGKNKENASTGLFIYPNLMAADILAYHATHVPVGEDQKQHLELTRDIAMRFNHTYGDDFFPIVEPIITEVAARVMSLRDGTKKMSKSDPSVQSRINLRDSKDDIVQKIKKAKTDADLLPDSLEQLEKRPEARNLVGIYAALKNISMEEAILQTQNMGFAQFKPLLSDIAVDVLEPISYRINDYLKDKAEMMKILHQGKEKAQETSSPIIEKTKKFIGFLP